MLPVALKTTVVALASAAETIIDSNATPARRASLRIGLRVIFSPLSSLLELGEPRRDEAGLAALWRFPTAGVQVFLRRRPTTPSITRATPSNARLAGSG